MKDFLLLTEFYQVSIRPNQTNAIHFIHMWRHPCVILCIWKRLKIFFAFNDWIIQSIYSTKWKQLAHNFLPPRIMLASVDKCWVPILKAWSSEELAVYASQFYRNLCRRICGALISEVISMLTNFFVKSKYLIIVCWLLKCRWNNSSKNSFM